MTQFTQLCPNLKGHSIHTPSSVLRICRDIIAILWILCTDLPAYLGGQMSFIDGKSWATFLNLVGRPRVGKVVGSRGLVRQDILNKNTGIPSSTPLQVKQNLQGLVVSSGPLVEKKKEYSWAGDWKVTGPASLGIQGLITIAERIRINQPPFLHVCVWLRRKQSFD